MAGLRDLLFHDYFGIDMAISNSVIREELPKHLEALKRVISKEGWAKGVPHS